MFSLSSLPSGTLVVALFLLLLTAGCSALAGSPDPGFEPVAADELVVQNADGEPHVLHVSVVENGSVVYVDSFQLNGTYRGEDGLVAPSVTADPNPMAEPGNYTVALRVDDGQTDSVWLSHPNDRLANCDPDDSPEVRLQADDGPVPRVLVGC